MTGCKGGHSLRRGRVARAGGLLLAGVCSLSGAAADDPVSHVRPDPAALPPAAASPPACPGGVDWTKVPPVRPLQRIGAFLVPPSGKGSYSLLDCLEGRERDKPPAHPYSVFGLVTTPGFDIDYRYLDDPKNTQTDFLDPLKRIHFGDDWLLSFGGQAWVRTMQEVDSRLGTVNNDYTLVRNRTHADLWYRDEFRLYAEYIYADSFDQNLNPLPIDINRSDLLDLFFDAKLWGDSKEYAYLRVGRQELLYGSQRLISTLDWANTRRTFQGAKVFAVGERWDVDAFWAQPVRVDRNDFDSVDNNQNFAGVWATRKVRRGTAFDFYYLLLDNTNPVARGRNDVPGGFTVHTLGTRAVGDKDNVLWDGELVLQLGDWSNQSKLAASCVGGVGYVFKDAPLKPQVWAYYDWASGENRPGEGGTNTTFNQLFPFGHYYFGFLDLVGRQNIHDVHLQAACYPAPWITALMQYHHFYLASSRDALYSAGGVVLRQDRTGRAGHDVGDELDFLVSVQLGAHSNLLVGWSKLYAGEFIRRSGPDVSPELLYMQYSFRW